MCLLMAVMKDDEVIDVRKVDDEGPFSVLIMTPSQPLKQLALFRLENFVLAWTILEVRNDESGRIEHVMRLLRHN